MWLILPIVINITKNLLVIHSHRSIYSSCQRARVLPIHPRTIFPGISFFIIRENSSVRYNKQSVNRVKSNLCIVLVQLYCMTWPYFIKNRLHTYSDQSTTLSQFFVPLLIEFLRDRAEQIDYNPPVIVLLCKWFFVSVLI